MSDELAIQQGQSTNPAYPLAGAAIGGAAGGFGAHYFTKPKYGSFDDIIKEAKDSAEFQSKLEKAEGEEKSFLERAKEVATKRDTAGAEYDKAFEEWKKTNGGVAGKVETDEYKKLVEAEQNAEKALNDKKAALAAEEIETKVEGKETLSESHKKHYETELAKSKRAKADLEKQVAEVRKAAEELAKPIKESLTPAVDSIYSLREELDAHRELIDKMENEFNATKDPAIKADIRKSINETKKEYNKLSKELETLLKTSAEKFAEGFEFPGLKGDKLKKAKADKAKEIRTFIESTIAERMYEKEVNTDVIKGLVDKRDQAFDTIKTIAKRDLSTVTPEKAGERVQLHIDKVETPNLERLKNLKEAYKNALAEAKAAGGNATTVTTEFKGKLLKIIPIEGSVTTTTSTVGKDAITLAKEGLTNKEKEILDKIVNGKNEEEIIKAFDEAIAQRQNNISKLTNAVKDVKSVAAKFTELGGEGAYVRDGVLYKMDGAKVEVKPKTIKLATGIELPMPKEVAALEREIAKKEAKIAELTEKLKAPEGTTTKVKKYTAEQIEAQIAKEKQALETAKAARETAYKALEDAPAKTAEELQKAFNEFKGCESKEKFMDTQAEEVTKKFKDDFKKQLERKFGFAEHANWKIAGVAAAGAALVGGLAYMLAPKDKA